MAKMHSVCGKLFRLLFPSHAHAVIAHVTPALLASRVQKAYSTGTQPCIAPLPYRDKLVRMVVHAAKYEANRRAAQLLGEVLAGYVSEELADRRMYGSFSSPLVVPIPLHVVRYNERGFNQSERIANAMVVALADVTITVAATVLVRTKNTHHQTLKHSKADRVKNVRSAFSVPRRQHVAGRDVLLLDDVITTGATLSEAVQALREAGAHNILCVAAAH